ncbi:S-layer domain-like protein [Nanobdella aerobiophila]|uniref:S-layer domain-like protein n=1 Tax=Nanobdella aerobiophila TaxID=2586965 RepID=A0A915WS09_9ARCH|nr:hypothetical protein [Nanobdella aerobiophila]BBL45849.1 S-layer domain-like protein [Nanobdella aerobiophila]
MNNRLVTTLKKLSFVLGALGIVGLAVYSQEIIIEPQTQTLLANSMNNMTFIVKLLGVNQVPVESYLYFDIFAPNGQLVYQYYEPVTVGTGLNIYDISVNPLQLQQLVQEYSNGYNNFTVEANVSLIYSNGVEDIATGQESYNITFVPYNFTLSMVNLPEVISSVQASENGLNIQSVSYLQNIGTNIQSATLTLTLYGQDGSIVYQTQEDVQLQPGENLLTINVPNYDLQNIYGQLYAEEQLTVVLDNGQVLNQVAEQSFYISNNENGENLQVLSISPNFNSLQSLGNSIYDINLLLQNSGYQTVNATVQLLLYNEYGYLEYNLMNSQDVQPGQQSEITLPLNTEELSPGYYNIILYLYQNGVVVNQYNYTVAIDQNSINPVNVISVEPNTYNILPGSYVQLQIQLQDSLPMEVQVTPMIQSEELNINQQLSTITLSPNQVEQLPVVIYIPNNLQAGYYPLNIVFLYNGAQEVYPYNIYVNGSVPVYTPISASLEAYQPLSVGQNTTIDLILTANTTSIYNLIIQSYAVGGKVYPKEENVQIGGTYSETIPLNVTAESGNVTVYVDVINANNGEILYSLNQTYTSTGEQLITPTYNLESIVFWILVAVAIIIIAAVLLESRGRGGNKKEKIEE